MFRKKWFWIIVIVLFVAGGGYGAYMTWLAPDEAVEAEAVMQTTTVTVGDLSITAAGTGMLVPSSERALSFSTSGTLEELWVKVGDRVQAGDVLAWIDDAGARQAVAEAELQVLKAEQGLALAQAQAELAVLQARADLDTAQATLDELRNWSPDEDEIELARANLVSAQAVYQNTLAKSGVDQTVTSRVSLEQAIDNLNNAQTNYTDAMSPDRDWEKDIENTRENAEYALLKARQNLEIAQTNYSLSAINSTTADIESAKAKVLSAQRALDDLEISPEEDEIMAAQIKVQQAALALAQAELDVADLGDGQTAATREAELALAQARLKLSTARETLEGTTLVAPFAGTVTAVNFEVGETVSGATVVLANLVEPVIQFWVEESDLSSVAAGHPVRIIFEALPDLTYEGEIYQVDPVLVNISSTPALQIWATIDTAAHPVTLLGEMNVEVEIIAGEALNALLVPVQALRQMGDQYAVFVVQPSGELEMRIVEVGLMDFVNAEVRSGLERGEVVSLGETTESSSGESTVTEPMIPGGGLFIPGVGRP